MTNQNVKKSENIVILPASGFGTRNKEHFVKELIIKDGIPLIENSFELLNGSKAEFSVLLITREEKITTLSNWWEDYRNNISPKFSLKFVIFEPAGGDWPTTIAAGIPYWGKRNVILLPDCRIKSQMDIPQIMFQALKNERSCWGYSSVPEELVSTYGNIQIEDSKAISVVEKPLKAVGQHVWGTFGFQMNVGRAILRGLEASQKTKVPYLLPEPSMAFMLDSFQDLSRTD